MKKVLHIHPADTVAVALQSLHAQETIELDGVLFQLKSDVPAGHKFALRDMAANEDIIKYGDPIGHATRAIAKGELVDHLNLQTNLEKGAPALQEPSTDQNPPPALPVREGADTSEGGSRSTSLKDSIPSLAGKAGGGSWAKDMSLSLLAYPRSDGQVGIRNDIWVIPTVGCVNGICRQIVERAGVGQHFPHNFGCSQLGDDHENTRLILRDMVLHPNAGGVLVVGLGCENNQPRDFEQLLGDYDRRRIRFLICQETEGDEVETGARIVQELYQQAQGDQRIPVPLSRLRVGLKCGGSDGFSGLTANPLLGVFSDRLCASGGTTILTEVPEMFGAEHLLMRRAASPEIHQQVVHLIDDFKNYYRSHGQPVGENPSPGNKAGGISTLEEKALGCTQKSGTSPVCGVLRYGERLKANGLHLLSAPGNDLVASTALAAAGCHLVLFTTGRGTPFSTFVPTVKVSTNSDLARRKPQWIDFDAGELLSGQSMHDMADRFFQFVLDIANGQPALAEQAGTSEISIWKNGVTL
ncbi:MAG: altronate dehydratase [Bacteroidaceae bacterium]|nr:altronate dehydratase [Bacteroidaceae bacterium]